MPTFPFIPAALSIVIQYQWHSLISTLTLTIIFLNVLSILSTHLENHCCSLYAKPALMKAVEPIPNYNSLPVRC